MSVRTVTLLFVVLLQQQRFRKGIGSQSSHAVDASKMRKRVDQKVVILPGGQENNTSINTNRLFDLQMNNR
jgi:hypothetical protein